MLLVCYFLFYFVVISSRVLLSLSTSCSLLFSVFCFSQVFLVFLPSLISPHTCLNLSLHLHLTPLYLSLCCSLTLLSPFVVLTPDLFSSTCPPRFCACSLVLVCSLCSLFVPVMFLWYFPSSGDNLFCAVVMSPKTRQISQHCCASNSCIWKSVIY